MCRNPPVASAPPFCKIVHQIDYLLGNPMSESDNVIFNTIALVGIILFVGLCVQSGKAVYKARTAPIYVGTDQGKAQFLNLAKVHVQRHLSRLVKDLELLVSRVEGFPPKPTPKVREDTDNSESEEDRD